MSKEESKLIEEAVEKARLPNKRWTILTGDCKQSFILGAKEVIDNPEKYGFALANNHDRLVEALENLVNALNQDDFGIKLTEAEQLLTELKQQ